MTPEKARKQANNIMEMFWHNFLKSESAFVMRDVIAIALENACNQTELPRNEEKRSLSSPDRTENTAQ